MIRLTPVTPIRPCLGLPAVWNPTVSIRTWARVSAGSVQIQCRFTVRRGREFWQNADKRFSPEKKTMTGIPPIPSCGAPGFLTGDDDDFGTFLHHIEPGSIQAFYQCRGENVKGREGQDEESHWWVKIQGRDQNGAFYEGRVSAVWVKEADGKKPVPGLEQRRTYVV
jgi:hypothetical protein